MLPTWLVYTIFVLIVSTLLLVIRRYEISKQQYEHEEKLRQQHKRLLLREAELKIRTAEARTMAVEAEQVLKKNQMRHRIAADLHDEIGSNLCSISLLCEMMQNNNNVDERLTQKFEEIRRIAMLSSEGLKDIIWFINPENDQYENLILRMKDTASSMLYNKKLKLSFSDIKLLEKVNLQFKRNFYLIYKEILHNVVKHSDAECAEVMLYENNQNFILSVKDDGVGFEKEKVSNGNGLSNLANRALGLGGVLEINSNKKTGTVVSLVVKIP